MTTKLGMVVVVLALAGCPNGPVGGTTKQTPTDPNGTNPTNPTTTENAAGWCKVQAVFNADCVACHDATLHQGNLDLQTSAYEAIVGVTSADFGVVLVEPGDPDASLLYRKMAGTQSASEGGQMPLAGQVDPAHLDAVRAWIADGATPECASTPTDTITGTGGAYHPPGWEDAPDHGVTTNVSAGIDPNGSDCRDCHGADLTGGTVSVSCDSCHQAGWRDDCTYCHGGELDTTGAPPQDIDDNADPDTISFPDHAAHVTGPRHPAYDCVQCHNKPTDALTTGHLFDDGSAGRAELDFSAGISSQGAPTGSNTCGNLWCHGDGAGHNGTVSIGDGPLDCTSCHSTGFGLNGEHGEHLGEGVDCAECHPDVSDSMAIIDDDHHVDGEVQVELPSGITFDGNSCDGTCHNESHNNRSW